MTLGVLQTCLRGKQRRAHGGQPIGRDLHSAREVIRAVAQAFDEIVNDCGSSSALDRFLYCDVHTRLVDDILVKSDRMSMGAGIEARVPFLDHKLVEFAASLPQHLKVSGLSFFLPVCLTVRLLASAFTDITSPVMCLTPVTLVAGLATGGVELAGGVAVGGGAIGVGGAVWG